jgi:predicted GTPase
MTFNRNIFQLINLATQSNQKLAESGDEDSCTSTVDAAPPFEQDGRRVILYDTPGFDDSRMSDTQVLQIILKELEAQ